MRPRRASPERRSMSNVMTSDRRSFLLRSAGAAAAASLLPAMRGFTQTSKLAPSPIRLGIASYTFRQFDSAKLIGFLHELRCPYVNLKDVHLKMGTAEEVKQQADAYRQAGLKLTGAGTIYFQKDDDADIRAKFDYCKAAGISLIVGAPTRAVLPRVEKFVKEYNIRLAIHNHGPEDKEWPSPLDILKAIGSMDSRIGCCVDVGHTMRAGTDVLDALQRVGPRLFDIHMKDLAQKDSKESQVAVGEGIMPVRAIFQQLIRMKYAGFVDLEYEIHGDNPLPGVQESFAYMRGVLTGMGYDTAE